MRIAFLGCGYVANMYRLTLPLQPELELVGVFDLDPERTANMARLTSSRPYESFESLLNDPHVELVVNLTNPRAHFDTTQACLLAGKHVYTEKPLAMQFDQAKELVRLATEKKLYLSSAPCTLLNEAAQTLWKALREKRVGQVRVVYAEMDDGMVHRMPVTKWINEAGTPWPYVDEFETGCTVEHAGYVLTWLAAFFGPAEKVVAFSACTIPDKVPGLKLESTPDFSVAVIRFANGIVARLTCGIYAPVDHRLRLFGDDGVMTLKDPRDDRSPLTIQRYTVIRRARMLFPWGRRYPLAGKHRKHVRYRGSQRRNFCSALAEMAQAIQAGRPCRLNADFCLHVNEMTLAIQYAMDTSQPYTMTTSFDPIEPMEWAK